MDEPICLRKEKYMFIIKPENQSDWADALMILSYYHVNLVLFSDGDNQESVYGRVEERDNSKQNVIDFDPLEQLMLAEMTFAGNWLQKGMICEDCEQEPGNSGICGHLTFTKPINPAF
jgi:hypothetical protein